MISHTPLILLTDDGNTSYVGSASAQDLIRDGIVGEDNVSPRKEKLIEVRGDYPTLHVGDSVTLQGSVRQGLRASLLAYIVPLILMVAALFYGTHLNGEAAGALASLLVLGIYYGVLYLLRNKLGKQFEFSITN